MNNIWKHFFLRYAINGTTPLFALAKKIPLITTVFYSEGSVLASASLALKTLL